jgi:two-component system chemotaxis response regulator CheY
MASVLIVDDSKSFLDMLVALVSELGHEVDAAVNGKEGYEKASNKQYHLILTDYNMPVMNGFEMTKSIRLNCKFNKDTPVICLTTEMSDSKKREGKEFKINGFMVKSFEHEMLTTVIQRTINFFVHGRYSPSRLYNVSLVQSSA